MVVNDSDFHDLAEARKLFLKVLFASANAQTENTQYVAGLRILFEELIRRMFITQLEFITHNWSF